MADKLTMYYIYVLVCSDGTLTDLYIGFTEDLRKRYAEHLTRKVVTTKRYNSVHLVYYEACTDKKDAMARERQLKTGFGRSYIKRRLQRYFHK